MTLKTACYPIILARDLRSNIEKVHSLCNVLHIQYESYDIVTGRHAMGAFSSCCEDFLSYYDT